MIHSRFFLVRHTLEPPSNRTQRFSICATYYRKGTKKGLCVLRETEFNHLNFDLIFHVQVKLNSLRS